MIVRITFDARVANDLDMHPEDIIHLVMDEIDDSDRIVSVVLLDDAEAAETDYIRPPKVDTRDADSEDDKEK